MEAGQLLGCPGWLREAGEPSWPAGPARLAGRALGSLTVLFILFYCVCLFYFFDFLVCVSILETVYDEALSMLAVLNEFEHIKQHIYEWEWWH